MHMRILCFEDDIYKFLDIKKAVGMAGAHELELVGSVEEGLCALRQASMDKRGFQLIISDMHYPVHTGAEGDFRAGEILLEELSKRSLKLPVIICSSMNLRIPGTLGCVWYSAISDWDMELAELVKQMEQ